MRLPESLPKLSEPSFILAEPVWIQVVALTICFLGGLATLWGFAHMTFAHPAPFWVKSILLLLGTFFLWIPFRKSSWRRWVAFAVDRRGCYFRQMYSFWKKGRFHSVDRYFFVPWDRIGTSSIGCTTDQDGTSRTVILQIKMSDEEWEKEFTQEGTYPRWIEFLKSVPDKHGYREFALGNHCQNVEKTRIAIEQIRPL